jgi:hypothetical protein
VVRAVDIVTEWCVRRGAGGEPERTGVGRPKGKPTHGRRQEYDPLEDKRLCDNWKAAKRQGMSRPAFTREHGISVAELIAAQDREKYRRNRDAE